MPAAYQGTLFRSTGDPIVDLKPPAGVSAEQQRARLDLLAKLNELDMKQYPGNSELAARISSYELAFRMQSCAPEAVDIGRESEATRKLYGLDDKVTEPFGRQCLMARRLVERGVRFVQLYHGGMGNQNTDTWDAHDDVKANHTQHAAEIGPPDRGPADRSEGARPARFDAGDLARRVRADADLAARRRARSQPGGDDDLDGGRGHQGRAGDRRERRVRLQGRAAADLLSRSARDDAAAARDRSQEAHLPVQRPRHAADRRVRCADSADCWIVRGGGSSAGLQACRPAALAALKGCAT